MANIRIELVTITRANIRTMLMTITMASSRTELMTNIRASINKEPVTAIQIILLEGKEGAVIPYTQQALKQEEYPLIKFPIPRDYL